MSQHVPVEQEAVFNKVLEGQPFAQQEPVETMCFTSQIQERWHHT